MSGAACGRGQPGGYVLIRLHRCWSSRHRPLAAGGAGPGHRRAGWPGDAATHQHQGAAGVVHHGADGLHGDGVWAGPVHTGGGAAPGRPFALQGARIPSASAVVRQTRLQALQGLRPSAAGRALAGAAGGRQSGRGTAGARCRRGLALVVGNVGPGLGVSLLWWPGRHRPASGGLPRWPGC